MTLHPPIVLQPKNPQRIHYKRIAQHLQILKPQPTYRHLQTVKNDLNQRSRRIKRRTRNVYIAKAELYFTISTFLYIYLQYTLSRPNFRNRAIEEKIK